MNILIATHYFAPHTGGVEFVALQQAKSLAAAGHTVTVITSTGGDRRARSRQNGFTVRRIPAWNILERRFAVPFPLFSPALLWQAFRAVRQADIVHAHDAFYMSSLAVAVWARMLRKPLVLTQHVALIPHPSVIVRCVQRMVYSTSGRFIFNTSRTVMVLNDTVRRFVAGQGVAKQRITHLPNSVDTDRFHPVTAAAKKRLRTTYGLPRTQPIVLFVGRLVPKKGVPALLALPADTYTVAFVGGDAPATMQPGNRHLFLGEQPPEVVADFYRAADIFVLPSQGEGFPLTAQEAMASGLPVVLADDPGYQAYRFDTELLPLIPPRTDAIHNTIQHILINPKLQRRMGTYARSYALQHFTLPAHLQALQTIYREAVA